MKKQDFNNVRKIIVLAMFLALLCPVANANDVADISTSFDVTQQQTKRISGIVKDSSGETIIGANVAVEGGSLGTITDLDGNFELNVPENATLRISYIGFSDYVVSVTGKTFFNIVMKEDTQALNEVLVVGFGTQKKVNLTGAVSNVDSKAFEGRAVANVSQALQGAMPGLNIQQTSGYLNDSPSINVRGIGTIGEGSSAAPLVLIDGMEGDLNRLNPQDIESVSVLKDAAAASIYGSRAPFGVILITTKKGKTGKLQVNYNNSFRWNRVSRMPKSVDSYTFATYYNDAASNSGQTPFFEPDQMQKIKDFMDGKRHDGIEIDPNTGNWKDLYNDGFANTDWIDVLFDKTTFAQEHNISVTGGSEKVKIFASVNYMGQDGIIKLNPEKYQRFTSNLKATIDFSDKLSMTYSTRYGLTDYDAPSHNETFFASWGYASQTWPTLIVYDPNGNLYAYATHALPFRDGGRFKQKGHELIQQLNLTFEPIKNWKFIGDVNYKHFSQRETSDKQKIYTYDPNGAPHLYTMGGFDSDYVKESYNGYSYLNTSAYSDYSCTLDKHYFKVMLGTQLEMYKSDNFNALRQGIIVSNLISINTTSGMSFDGKAVSPVVGGAYNKWITAGYFGRINYNYDEKYLLEVNLRYDGTSRFRADKRWKMFPSFSLGWNVAREKFFDSLADKIHTLKLRASYGQLGNQNTDNWYPTYATMPIGNANGDWLVNGERPNSASAPALISTSMTWETVNTLNFGFDLGMLNNRLNMSLDIFNRKTNNMVGPAPELPDVLGVDVPKTNNTDLKTKGWELSVSWRDLLPNGFSYHVNANLSDSKTIVTNYPNNSGNVTSLYSGKEMGEIWGFETVGIAKTQEEMDRHLASLPNGGQDAMDSQGKTTWGAGDIMYRDLNGDGKIDWGNSTMEDHGDMKVIGNETPRYNFGISMGFEYKGFDFSIMFQGTMKRDYFTGHRDFWGAESLWGSTAYDEHMDYFRNDPDHYLGENLDSYYPRPLFDTDKNKHAQTRYLLNGAYIRLKNVNLGYTLPASWVSKMNLSNIRIFVTGENLWTGTKLPGFYDPETFMSYGGAIHYPLAATYSFGASITF